MADRDPQTGRLQTAPMVAIAGAMDMDADDVRRALRIESVYQGLKGSE